MKFTLQLLLAGLLLSIGSLATAAPFTPSPDGQEEVTDDATGLIWRRCAEGMTWNANVCSGTAFTFTHEAALARAASQAATTAVAWRLPDIRELVSISNPTNDPAGFDAATSPGDFWSSTPRVGAVPTLICGSVPGCAWYATINGGAQAYYRSTLNYVRLVR